MFRSATFKLTLWYLAIVMAISIVFSVVLYNVATAELSRGLHHETERIFQQFPVIQGSPLLAPGSDYDSGAHRILLRLLAFNIIVLFTAGLSSYWLARRTLEPIEEAHEQQKRFTADVSHELRTPLTVLRMESEVALMNNKTSSSELRNILKSNLEEIGKLEALINNLLRLTRLEADELQQEFYPVNAKDIADKAIKQVLPNAKRRDITMKSSLKNSSLNGDEESLVQLVVILLDNAIKYSPNKGEIEVKTDKFDDEVSIKVIDHGVGIKREDLEHVFERFYRADSSRTGDETSGHGLGLSIAKMIADVHEGSITLSSRPGHGTTAEATFPLLVPAVELNAEQSDTK